MVAWHEVPGNGPVKIRPVRYDRVTLLSRNQGAYSLNKPQFDSHRLTPCPTGRTHDLAVPGTSCQATIILSLRDTTAFALGFFNRTLVSCPINNMAFVAIKMGRRQGARRAHICIDT
jgi:hypothetical protein